MRKVSFVTDANKVAKTKKMVITTFSNFFQMPNSIFRRRENPFRERPQTDAYSHFLFSNQISWLRCWVSGVSGGKGEKTLLSPSPLGRPDTQANVSEEDFLCKISDESLEIFSRPQIVANSRQYLLLWTDILQKNFVGCPLCQTLKVIIIFLITEEEWRLPPVQEDQNPHSEYIYV